MTFTSSASSSRAAESDRAGMTDVAAMHDVDAVILAGGLGTRLRSVVSDRPKVLAEVGGRPFLELLLDQVAAAGIRRTILCTGYLGDQVETRLGPSYKDVALLYSREAEPLGTGGALRLALPKIASPAVLVLNGDSYCDWDADDLYGAHRRSRAQATMLLVRVSDARRFGRVVVDGSGRIVRFTEKSDDPSPALINAGIYLLARGIIERLEPGKPLSLEREVFPTLIGHGLYGHPTRGQLWDIGIPEAYAEAGIELPERLSR